MGRTKTSAPLNYSPLSGELGEELKKHAHERCRHYYHYAFYLSALYELLSNRSATSSKVTTFITKKASHQIDSGHRSKNPQHNTWVADPSVVNMPVTAFKKMDAAHFCNLGATPELKMLVNRGGDGVETRFMENLEAIMGNTRPMPQKVNIGPDRIVDELHGRKIYQDLTQDQPTVSSQRINEYLCGGASAMRAYVQSKLRDRPGLKACAECYIDYYEDPGSSVRLYNQLSRETEEECSAYGLDSASFVR